MTQTTKRPISEGMEAAMGSSFPVLDHGYVRVVDYFGNDSAIVQAARVSYGAGTKKAREDEGLIRYLMRHRHTTPFEMCEVKFHIKLPIFVARQWIRHRTANVNEYSARYSVLDREFYIPRIDEVAAQSSSNAQGREGELDKTEALDACVIIDQTSSDAFDAYEELLSQDGKKGVARELARMVLPTNTYTQWYWKTDLHNLLHFLSLRADSHAQYEIREYAAVICGIVEEWVPMAWKAFEDYNLNAVHLSAAQMKHVRCMLGQGMDKTPEMTQRELNELHEIIGDK